MIGVTAEQLGFSLVEEISEPKVARQRSRGIGQTQVQDFQDVLT